MEKNGCFFSGVGNILRFGKGWIFLKGRNNKILIHFLGMGYLV